jgi:G3E family GTPase
MKVVIVGGFLGAGKTTLIRAAALHLVRTGKRVGVVTNDQAPELVDTALLQEVGAPVLEIAGSCFCCNFDAFSEALSALSEQDVEIVLAEPVGSCTDLVSTIIRPLRRIRPEFELAPLTVLADPARLTEALEEGSSGMDPDAIYIYRKQLEEADLCLITKVDSLTQTARATLKRLDLGAPMRLLSSVTGEGLAEWLEDVLLASSSGSKRIEVDYDRYAHGEAVLGWLNARYELKFGNGIALGAIAESLVRKVLEGAKAKHLEIGHVKVLVNLRGHTASANVTALCGEIEAHEAGDVGPSDTLILNARVQTDPEQLKEIVETAVQGIADHTSEITCRALRSLSPGRPVPTHRM